jgi:hypothetical protein
VRENKTKGRTPNVDKNIALFIKGLGEKIPQGVIRTPQIVL